MELTYKINKTRGFILDYLSDMQKFVSVHPVIYKIENRGENQYLVYEKLKFVFIPFSFTYPVIIEQNENSVMMKAIVMKLTRIEINFRVRVENGFTVVDETIHFRSPLPVKRIMQGIFRKQHAQLFRNIDLLPTA